MSNFRDDLEKIIRWDRIIQCWNLIERSEDGFKFVNKADKISVIISIKIESDNRKWIHLSFARPKQMPDYWDMKNIKDIFLPNRKAILIMPEDDKHVNIHPYCLHLFHCLDEDPLPEFSGFIENYYDGKKRTL